MWLNLKWHLIKLIPYGTVYLCFLFMLIFLSVVFVLENKVLWILHWWQAVDKNSVLGSLESSSTDENNSVLRILSAAVHDRNGSEKWEYAKCLRRILIGDKVRASTKWNQTHSGRVSQVWQCGQGGIWEGQVYSVLKWTQ